MNAYKGYFSEKEKLYTGTVGKRNMGEGGLFFVRHSEATGMC